MQQAGHGQNIQLCLFTADEARELTDRIRHHFETVAPLIAEAYQGRIWLALGYATWSEYVVGEFGVLRLGRTERVEAVRDLREAGMSTRAIGAALGVDHTTVMDDMAGGGNPPPAPVTGLDGKTYPASTGLGVHFSSDSPEWYTPSAIVAKVIEALGAIDLDPCSNEGTPNVPAWRYFTEADDGLAHEWHGRVYMNPPYGRGIGDWVDKLAAEYEAGRTTEAIALVPARVDTAWWRRLPHRDWLAVSGRLSFSGHDNSAPFPSGVCYLGPDSTRFREVFAPIGDGYARWADVA